MNLRDYLENKYPKNSMEVITMPKKRKKRKGKKKKKKR